MISANGEFYNLNARGDGDQDTLIFRHDHDTLLGFDAGLDIPDLGGRSYTDTGAGTLLTAGQDAILLAGDHDFEV